MSILRHVLAVAALVALVSSAASAQTRTGLMGDLIADVTEVESKIVGLARAMPEAAYAWRPGKGVRSVAETLAHVAADNYFMPSALGVPAPAATGIAGTDYKTSTAFEQRTRTRDQIIADLEQSFAFLKKAMAGTSDAALASSMKVFGRETVGRTMWVATVTHLHEHLGQLIAYARSNDVVPPWSR